ncbi:NADH-ubiquinone oxidoreductase B14 subunit [Metarhizium album ARSEF 1941]|uniref:NADH-ubiquinone oxidoreductase B14 subunit n=1 Tax=Metarhizium album (strain ARSEF 1941) TaxID=1081103 RepID=A0A0B2WQ44_METAS|nr:NADH-ubiquinone oxidoreductase B14 subunit [Metarhizium album ARSEF 1941]KHN95115.1 NADH-ubiquinone oxidoreductase B14 subunit [Metarhizium album ARSEF 1941]
MAITPTQFAKKTAQCMLLAVTLITSVLTNSAAANWSDAKRRVLSSYREWIRAAPEIQTMYNMPLPISAIRTRVRQEFERNRYANKLPVVDVLLFKSHAEYQEMMNFWKQTTHVMSYFKEENFRGDKRLPSSFIDGFLEGRN